MLLKYLVKLLNFQISIPKKLMERSKGLNKFFNPCCLGMHYFLYITLFIFDIIDYSLKNICVYENQFKLSMNHSHPEKLYRTDDKRGGGEGLGV